MLWGRLGKVLLRLASRSFFSSTAADAESNQAKKWELSKRYAALLQKCGASKQLMRGEQLHAEIVQNGLGDDTFVGNHLVQMYGKCGSMEEVRAVFRCLLHKRNVFSWTIMIGACIENGLAREAMEQLWLMDQEGVKMDKITFIHAAGACGSLGLLPHCRALSSRAAEDGFYSNAVVGNALVSMFVKAGSTDDASEVFFRLPEHNVVAWTSLISGYGTTGHLKPFLLFREMLAEGVMPNEVTFVTLLRICASNGALDHAKFVHQLLETSEYISAVNVATALVDAYGKCGRPELAAVVFEEMQQRDVVAWNAMAAVLAQQGRDIDSLKLFWRMQLGSEMVDDVTFIAVLDACCNLRDLAIGKRIHELIAEAGFQGAQNVANSLLNMYGKCGDVENARSVFDAMNTKNVVSWSAMVAAYAQNGYGREAMKLYGEMLQHGVKPDEYAFTTLVDACSAASALAEGRLVHRCIEAEGLDRNVVIGTVLISMYGKCGKLEEALLAFEKLGQKSLLPWTALIAGYAQHGGGKVAEQLFREMLTEGVPADEVVLLSLLHGCSHAGRLKDGWNCFRSMVGDYGVQAGAEHFGCMVDLLARSGRLKEAEELLYSMPFELDVAWFKALLAACRVHGDRLRGERIAGMIPSLGADEPAPYLIMSNMYASLEIDTTAVSVGRSPSSLGTKLPVIFAAPAPS